MPVFIELKIRMTSPCLGQQHTGKSPGSGDSTVQIRRFRKVNGRIAFDIAHWLWALSEAAAALKLKDVDVSCVRTEDAFESPSLHLYVRRWTQNNKPRQECFEAIREGTVLTLPVYLINPEPNSKDKRSPTPEELEAMLSFVGKWIGISPWGNKFGYGRFNVEVCRPAEPVDAH